MQKHAKHTANVRQQ